MKRIVCALLAAALLATGASALAAAKLTEITMLYEDYDGNREEQTVVDEATLKELQDMLLRASRNPAELDGCTMNCTLLCTVDDGDIRDFAVATDGCPFITDSITGKTYRLEDADRDRLWEIFDLVQEVMGYDAAAVLNW